MEATNNLHLAVREPDAYEAQVAERLDQIAADLFRAICDYRRLMQDHPLDPEVTLGGCWLASAEEAMQALGLAADIAYEHAATM